MHCGGKKKKNQPCPASIISRVFQASWFPKPKGTKTQPVLREARFYSTDDAYWRLSFSTEDRKSITAIPVPGFKSRKTEEKQCKKLGRAAEDDGNRMPFNPVMEKYIFPIKKSVCNSRNFSLVRSVDEDYTSGGRLSNSDKLNYETEFRVEPTCMISRKMRERRIKTKGNSPKSEFRVRALEGMKKERSKSKKETKEPETDGTTVYDSFAEMKTSFDPQQDFRDSMVEMICGKGIRRREELEDLLACYLTLNHDKYHDLIIRVFKQVWLELREDTDDPENKPQMFLMSGKNKNKNFRYKKLS